MKKNLDVSLYLVTNRLFLAKKTLEDVIFSAIEGGVTMVQLREKELSSLAFYDQAIRLKKILSSYKIPLIINDRLDIALACNADGLHIGQSDLPYTVARKILGKDKIIGLSVENEKQVIEANQWDVDYIGISPVFSTATKTDTAAPFGIKGVEKAKKLSKHLSVGIGGINAQNAGEVIKAGADGIAVVSAIISSTTPKESAQELKNIILSSKK